MLRKNIVIWWDCPYCTAAVVLARQLTVMSMQVTGNMQDICWRSERGTAVWSMFPSNQDDMVEVQVYYHEENIEIPWHSLSQWRPCAISSVQVTPHKLPWKHLQRLGPFPGLGCPSLHLNQVTKLVICPIELHRVKINPPKIRRNRKIFR